MSLQEAREKGLKRYFTGVACKRGHVAERRIANKNCIECFAITQAKYKSDNKDKLAARQAERRQSPKYHVKMEALKKSPEWRAKRSTTEAKRRENPEVRARLAEAAKRWIENPKNRAKASAAEAKRREDPKYRAKRAAEAVKRYRADPELRAKTAARDIRRGADPEWRARRSVLRKTPKRRAYYADYQAKRLREDAEYREKQRLIIDKIQREKLLQTQAQRAAKFLTETLGIPHTVVKMEDGTFQPVPVAT